MKRWLYSRLPDCMALLLGVLLVLAFAPFHVFPFAILAPAGLLLLISNATPRRAAWLGFLFGLGLFGAGIYWVFISIHLFGDVPSYIAVLITAALVSVLSIFTSLVCFLTSRFFPVNYPTKYVLAFPAIWLAVEWLRSLVACGFPWLFLGYSQTLSPLKGYAPLLSVYGVSLAVLISSGLLVYAYQTYRQQAYRDMYGALLSLCTIWLFGFLLSLIPWTYPEGKALNISLVQGNIPQSIKWSPTYADLSLDRYAELSAPLWGKSDIIVWPEAAIPLTLQDAEAYIEQMDQKALQYQSSLVLGIPVQNEKGPGYYNAVVTLGARKNAYLKRNLVPFGEYVPFQRYASRILDFLHVPVPDLRAGSYHQPPLQVGDVKINTSICFEIAFPELVRMRDPSVGLLLTVTNDAWFGKSIAQAQHLQMGIMRAIELNRPVLFVSNDGITAIINPDGTLQATAPTHQSYVLTSRVQPMAGLTPWMTNGMDPIIVILLCCLLGARRPYFDKKREYDGSTIQPTRH